jgi:hypothetical protein
LTDFESSAPGSQQRREQREDKYRQGKAVIRVSGIPICEFPIKDVSGNGSCFLVAEDSSTLRNLRVGQEIHIQINLDEHAGVAEFMRSRIAHITKAEDERFKGHYMVGVQILSRM